MWRVNFVFILNHNHHTMCSLNVYILSERNNSLISDHFLWCLGDSSSSFLFSFFFFIPNLLCLAGCSSDNELSCVMFTVTTCIWTYCWTELASAGKRCHTVYLMGTTNASHNAHLLNSPHTPTILLSVASFDMLERAFGLIISAGLKTRLKLWHGNFIYLV